MIGFLDEILNFYLHFCAFWGRKYAFHATTHTNLYWPKKVTT